jgi:hypothetical protein
MGTVLRRTNKSYKVTTSRLVTVNTGSPTQIAITSAAFAVNLTNVGPTRLTWGDSSITNGSGGLLFYSQSKTIEPIQHNFTVFMTADSAAGVVAVNEMR